MTRRVPTYRWGVLPFAFLLLYTLALFSGCDSTHKVFPEESAPEKAASIPKLLPESDPRPPSPHVADVMVEVQGAISNPGIYRFSAESRIYNAIEHAGGTLPLAEIRDLNIAARLIDGSVLSIPYRQQDGEFQPTAAQLNPPTYTRSGWRGEAEHSLLSRIAPGSSSACVNLNTATQTELEALPGVGPKTANKIMRYRTQQPFVHVDDLRNIQGIGEKRLQSLRPLVCV